MFNLFGSIKAQHAREREARRHSDVIRRAAKIGGGLFGPVPAGVRREFFCLNEHTWVWHEEWTDEQGKRHVVTTRYDIRPNGILKAQDGQPYRSIDMAEAKHLYKAIKLYNRRLKTEPHAR